MALPKAVDAAKVQAVNAAILKMSPQQIGALPPLEDEDFRLFGAISQHYCFLDLNLRRALEVMHMAKRLPPEHLKKYPYYTDASLAEILGECVKNMDRSVENVDEALFRLEEVGRCRAYRNLLNHFAGKRYSNEDVYVLASKNTKDAEKVLGKKLDAHRVHFAVAGRSELFELEKLLNGHQAWLAQKIPEWDTRYLKDPGTAADAAK